MFWRAGVPLAAGVLIALCPAPAGLAPQAWNYCAIFVAVILALVTEPLPSAAVGFVGVTLIAALGLPFTAAQKLDPSFRLPAEAIKWALTGFANSTVWLIFGAFVFAMGYEKTGLGRRIALVLVRSMLKAPADRSGENGHPCRFALPKTGNSATLGQLLSGYK